MKRIMLMIVVLFVTFFQAEATKPKITIELSFELARPKHNCTKGIWFCKVKGDVDIELIGRAVKATFTDNQDGTMTINFKTPLPEVANEFNADDNESVSLSPMICKQFGYSSMIIVPGTYKVIKNGSFGSVTVKMLTN